MTGGPWRFAALVLATTGAFAALTGEVPSRAWAAPANVGVVAPRESRLADDLRRELEASRFVVVSVAASAADWKDDARRLPGAQVLHGVVVRADEQVMVVFTRPPGPGGVVANFEQKVESDDRLARRRACLGVVEYLRVLIENDAAPSMNLGPSSMGRDAPARVTAAAGGTTVAPSPATSVVHGGATSAVKPPPVGAASAPSPPATAPTVSPPKNNAAIESATAGPNLAPSPPDAERFWELGVGTTLGLNAAPGGPTAHLQILWYLPLDWRLAVCVRGLWPVLGGQFRSAGSEVRTWTFGAAASMQYLFEVGPTRLQPFIGASLGSRVALTETSSLEGVQSRKTFTPSAYLGADAGARYLLGPRLKLFVEAGLAHGWLIPGIRRLDYEADAASADSFHATFGVLFEI